MVIQRELVFHDTTPQREEDIPKAREDAKRQTSQILEIFRQHHQLSFTPYEIWLILGELGSKMLLTSVRRSITNLTKEGKITKCQWSESRPGEYGKLNRVWRFNSEFVNRLNP